LECMNDSYNTAECLLMSICPFAVYVRCAWP